MCWLDCACQDHWIPVHAGGAFSPTPRIRLSTPEGTASRFVTVRRAPEPSDVWWENTRRSGPFIVQRRALIYSLYGLLLLFAFSVQLLLAVLAESERVDNKDVRIGMSNDMVCHCPCCFLHSLSACCATSARQCKFVGASLCASVCAARA